VPLCPPLPRCRSPGRTVTGPARRHRLVRAPWEGSSGGRPPGLARAPGRRSRTHPLFPGRWFFAGRDRGGGAPFGPPGVPREIGEAPSTPVLHLRPTPELTAAGRDRGGGDQQPREGSWGDRGASARSAVAGVGGDGP